MRKNILKLGVVFAFALLVSTVAAQTTVTTKKTEVIQNQDGTYTVIEYPVGKEVVVDLTPAALVQGSKATAKVMRAADGTKVWVDLAGVTGDTTAFHAYAVDPAGTPTYLGPLTVANGVAKGEFSTPMNQFMLVLSPTEGLTTLDTTTPVVYRSALPTGYTVVPKRVSETRVVATTPASQADYAVPLLNVPSFGEKEKEVKLKFAGELEGLEAKAYVDREKGVTKVKMHFDDLKKIPANKRFTLWTSSADGTFTKLGQIVNSGSNNEAQIRSETTLTDFGLFMTVEDADVKVPTSKTYSVFTVAPIS